MSGVRSGARWHLRLALAAVLLFDLIFLSVTLSVDAPGPRALAQAPAVLRALVGRPELVVPLGLLGLIALARFAARPGRAGAGLGVIAVIGVLCEARAANNGGPERFLFAAGTVLAGWIAGLVFVRAAEGDRDAEEIGAETGAVAALAAIYVNAALQKLGAAGLGWADGDDLRMLVLAQRPLGASSAIADLVIEHRWIALGLAAFTELAQLSALAYPFHPRARVVIGTMLLAFHTGVWMVTPILFPQSMALLVAFSYPWGALLSRRGMLHEQPGLILVRRLDRGALVIGAICALLAGLALSPPGRSTILSLSHTDEGHRRDAPAERPRREPEPASFDATAASTLGIERLGASLAGCTVTSVAARGEEIALRLACGDGELGVEVVEAGSRPHAAPRSAGGRDLFYASGATVSPAERDAVLAELARRLAPP